MVIGTNNIFIKMNLFKLNEQEYIELNKLLKIEKLVATGGEAKFIIKNGEVYVNDKIETQVRKKLYKGDRVTFFNQEIEIV